MSLRRRISEAQKKLQETTEEVLASGELVLWRKQLIGEKNPMADNAMGMDPHGRYWRTQDYVVSAQLQGTDSAGRQVIYSAIDPAKGDLIIALNGAPQTSEEALLAAPRAYYSVDDYDVRRREDEIIYTKILCTPDRSGQWNNYYD